MPVPVVNAVARARVEALFDVCPVLLMKVVVVLCLGPTLWGGGAPFLGAAGVVAPIASDWTLLPSWLRARTAYW